MNIKYILTAKLTIIIGIITYKSNKCINKKDNLLLAKNFPPQLTHFVGKNFIEQYLPKKFIDFLLHFGHIYFDII
jgi:hypothetical protein